MATNALTWSFLIPCHRPGEVIVSTVRAVQAKLEARAQRIGESYEILIIPNGETEGADSTRALVVGAGFDSRVRIVEHTGTVGKGQALRCGVREARGRWIATTDADLPYDLSALDTAALRLAQGYDLVHANRRRADSEFVIPIPLLPLAYGRHRLGLLFNWFVRLLFPIGTHDTQAGFKCMSAEFAREAFALSQSPGFFYDVELFLVAREGGFFVTEIPVTLRLATEKSTIRLARDAVSALRWLVRIALRFRAGKYRPAAQAGAVAPVTPRLKPWLAAQRDALSWGTHLFLRLRWWLTPYRAMAEALPPRGEILDLGCGHGLLELALRSPGRRIHGIDHDTARVRLAQAAFSATGGGVTITEGSVLTPPAGTFDGIAMIDVLHYFSDAEQRRAIQEAASRLSAHGVLIAREVDPQGGLISRWNRLYERMATAIGFTRSDNATQLTFRSRTEWQALFEEFGLEVESRRCSHPLFADILYTCRPRTQPISP